MNDYTSFTRNQLEEISNKWISILTKEKTKEEKPSAFLLGGQAGAGKTTLHEHISKEMYKNIVIIDNDRFKQSHPNIEKIIDIHGKDYIKHVTPFSNSLTELLIQKLSDQKYNLVIEGTLRTTEVPLSTAKLLINKNYNVNLYVMAVSKELSLLSIDKRFEQSYSHNPKTARLTPVKIHDEIIENLPTNINTLFNSQIFSEIKLLNREGEELYSKSLTPLKSPENTLKREVNRKLSNQEKSSEIDQILTLAEGNGHLENDRIKKLSLEKKNLQNPFSLSEIKKLSKSIEQIKTDKTNKKELEK